MPQVGFSLGAFVKESNFSPSDLFQESLLSVFWVCFLFLFLFFGLVWFLVFGGFFFFFFFWFLSVCLFFAIGRIC